MNAGTYFCLLVEAYNVKSIASEIRRAVATAKTDAPVERRVAKMRARLDRIRDLLDLAATQD